MNFKLVLRVTGFTLLIEAGAMLIPLAVSLLYGESPIPFLCSILIILAAAAVTLFPILFFISSDIRRNFRMRLPYLYFTKFSGFYICF